MILDVKNLSKSFGGVQAVSGCGFNVSDWKITALIGPNGAGKTTIFNLINGFISADEGKVFFQGRDITNLSAWERSRSGMSRTFQLSRLFKNLTLRENLVLAIRQDDDRFWKMFFSKHDEYEFDSQIKEAMEFLGFKKELETRVTELSYGEQKLFDLTRAYLNPHTMLLLDEPVAGVNPVLRESLKKIMLKLKERGETILLIEHDMDFVHAVADRVIVLDQGSVLTEGEPEKVLHDNRVLEVYLGSA